MKFFNSSGYLLAAVAALMIGAPASATVISSFNSSSTFNTSTGHAVGADVTFNGSPSALFSTTNPGYTVGGVSLTGFYSVSGGGTQTGWFQPTDLGIDYGSGNYIVGGYMGNLVNGTNTSTMVLNVPTANNYTSFGFDFAGFKYQSAPIYGGSVTIQVKEVGGSYTTVNTPGGASTWSLSSTNALSFFGVTTTGAISDIQISFTTTLSNQTYPLIAVDNVRFVAGATGGTGTGGDPGTTELPEPATMLMAGVALVGLGYFSRKQHA